MKPQYNYGLPRTSYRIIRKSMDLNAQEVKRLKVRLKYVENQNQKLRRESRSWGNLCLCILLLWAATFLWGYILYVRA